MHVVGHGLDTRREESKILLAVSGAMAEAYRDEISRRTRRGLEGRAIAGQPVLETVKADLRDPAGRKPKADSGKRAAELQREIENLADAIAGRLLKSSPTLARNLAAAEAELAKVQASQPVKAPVLAMAPRVADRYLQIVDRLDAALGHDPERAGDALVDALGSQITLQPDASGKFLGRSSR